MTEVRIDRLERMVALLDRHIAEPKINFNLASWVTSVSKRGGITNLFRKVECHTAACAVGLALVSGEFKEEGLKMGYETIDGTSGISPLYEGETSYTAVAKLFGISRDQAIQFFSPNSYYDFRGKEAALAVRNRICKFVGNLRFEETKAKMQEINEAEKEKELV
jgi:hypothetical protein